MSEAQDRMWAHLQQARWLMDPCFLRDSIDSAIYRKFNKPEVPGVSPEAGPPGPSVSVAPNDGQITIERDNWQDVCAFLGWTWDGMQSWPGPIYVYRGTIAEPVKQKAQLGDTIRRTDGELYVDQCNPATTEPPATLPE